MSAPLMCQWDGEAMVPASKYWATRADQQFVVGEIYKIVEHHDRSDISHRHEFASIAEMWKSLPERYAHEPWAQTAEHLRKYALIRTRWCDTQTFPCGSHAEALRWAANLRPLDEYSVVTVEGSLVYRFTAQSQSRRAMGKEKFQQSKTDIIEFIEDLIGAERGSSENSRAA